MAKYLNCKADLIHPKRASYWAGRAVGVYGRRGSLKDPKGPVRAEVWMRSVDALVITALREEYDAATSAGLAGFADNPGVAVWEDRDLDTATPYAFGRFVVRDGFFRVAVARPTRMGSTSTAPIAASLVERLDPYCVAMCGVCAGNPADVAIGDVIIAEMAYTYDEGKRTVDGFEGDHRHIQMHDTWVRAAQNLQPADLPSYGDASDEDAKLWLLERLLIGDNPRRHPARSRYFPGDSWRKRLQELQAEGMLVRTPTDLALTDLGRDYVQRSIYDDVLGPRHLPFSVRVGPIASGNVVVKDGVTWERLKTLGVRSVLGLEMEGATIAAISHRLGVPAWVVVKGVMDHADPHKDDRHKQFAARASAEVLWKLLTLRSAEFVESPPLGEFRAYDGPGQQRDRYSPGSSATHSSSHDTYDQTVLKPGPTHRTVDGSSDVGRLPFRLVDGEYLQAQTKLEKRSFVARPVTWSDVVHGADQEIGFVERDSTGPLLSLARSRLLPLRPADDRLPVLFVVGAPGAGKTTIVRRVAAELVLSQECVVVDLGLGQARVRSSTVDRITEALIDVAIRHERVLVVADDPFSEGAGWLDLLTNLAESGAENISVIAATPTLLHDQHEWRIDNQLVLAQKFVLGPPSTAERRSIAMLYGRQADVFADREDEDFLVLAIESLSGEAFADVVARIWRTLNGGAPIDPARSAQLLPWLVRAYMIVCVLHSEGLGCPEGILRTSLELVDHDGDAVPNDLGHALNDMIMQEGWHIFAIDRLKMVRGTPEKVFSSAHASVARTAMQMRPARAFDPMIWLLEPAVLCQPGSGHLVGTLVRMRADGDPRRGSLLGLQLANVLRQALYDGIVPVVAACDAAAALVGNTDAAAPLESLLWEWAFRYEPSSWLAAMCLYETSDPTGQSRVWPSGLDTSRIFTSCDVNIASAHAVELVRLVRDDATTAPLVVGVAIRHLADAHGRGPLSSFVAAAANSLNPAYFIAHLAHIAEHLDHYPDDAQLRVAALRSVPRLTPNEAALRKRLVDGGEVWLSSGNLSNRGVLLAWLTALGSSGFENRHANLFRSILDLVADEDAARCLPVFRGLLQSVNADTQLDILVRLLQRVVQLCGDIDDANTAQLGGVLAKAYRLANRFAPLLSAKDPISELLRQVYEIILLWRWFYRDEVDVGLPPPPSGLAR